MTESILEYQHDAEKLFATEMPTPLVIIDLLNGGGIKSALKVANEKFGFRIECR